VPSTVLLSSAVDETRYVGDTAAVVFLVAVVAAFVGRERRRADSTTPSSRETRTIRPVTASLFLCRSVSVPAYAERGAVDRLNAGIPAVFTTTSTA
jgi:hypothetical protein